MGISGIEVDSMKDLRTRNRTKKNRGFYGNQMEYIYIYKRIL